MQYYINQCGFSGLYFFYGDSAVFKLRNKKAAEFMRWAARDHSVNFFKVTCWYDGFTIFHLRKFKYEIMTEMLNNNPDTNPFEIKDHMGYTIFHRVRHSEKFIKWCLDKWSVNPFELTASNGKTIFHQHIFSDGFMKELFDKYPDVNIFELKDHGGNTIFHTQRCSDNFLKWCLEKWPTNLFEVKEKNYNTIFHFQKYSNSILRDQVNKYPTNPLDLVNRWGSTIFHNNNYCHKFLKEYNVNFFELKDNQSNTIFHTNKREELLKECLAKHGVDIFDIRNNFGNTVFHRIKYSDDFMFEHLSEIKDGKEDPLYSRNNIHQGIPIGKKLLNRISEHREMLKKNILGDTVKC